MQNRGVEAIIVPTVEKIKEFNQKSSISILTRTPRYDKIRLKDLDVNLEPESKHLHTSKKSKSIFDKFYHRSKSVNSQESTLIKNASLMIASGGDVFSPEYSIYSHLKPLEIAISKDIPIFFLAQSISPYKTESDTEAWLRVARHAKAITVREKLTFDYLTNVLGLSKQVVKLTADPAFLLPELEYEKAQKLLEYYGVKFAKPLVAISASQGICSYASKIDYRKHLNTWNKIINLILNDFNAEVVLIPHVQKPNSSSDDRILATELLRESNYDQRVHLIGADHTAAEFKGIISVCDLVIAERTHAAIAGFSTGVCTIGVGYSVKAEGIANDFLSQDLLKNGCLISIQDFLDSDSSLSKIRYIWEKRSTISGLINNKIPNIKNRAASNFEILRNLI